TQSALARLDVGDVRTLVRQTEEEATAPLLAELEALIPPVAMVPASERVRKPGICAGCGGEAPVLPPTKEDPSPHFCTFCLPCARVRSAAAEELRARENALRERIADVEEKARIHAFLALPREQHRALLADSDAAVAHAAARFREDTSTGRYVFASDLAYTEAAHFSQDVYRAWAARLKREGAQRRAAFAPPSRYCSVCYGKLHDQHEAPEASEFETICSVECSRRLQALGIDYGRLCFWCGLWFIPHETKHLIYCSPRCLLASDD